MNNNLKDDLKEISVLGQLAFSVNCFENYVLTKYPDKNWKTLLKKMWSVSSAEWIDDDWFYPMVEYMPEVIFDANDFESYGFNYLSKSEFNYLTDLYKDCNSDVNHILTVIIEDMVNVYLYTSISDQGEELNDLVLSLVDFLSRNNIEIPDIKKYKFAKWGLGKGKWGVNFDASVFSKLDLS
ncbi:MAG: hypothetical protein HUJ58_07175 [Erysipelotrichaceae bacterium]|nr:hypothetical protein [Erysipelotrichaceae bacterium]